MPVKKGRFYSTLGFRFIFCMLMIEPSTEKCGSEDRIAGFPRLALTHILCEREIHRDFLCHIINALCTCSGHTLCTSSGHTLCTGARSGHN